MNEHVAFDEHLLQRLPLPLAQLCRRSLNAQSAEGRHNAAFFVWEAAVKLFGSVAVVSYADLPRHDPALIELLQSLARPSLGHWWGFARTLMPVLAEHDDEGFRIASELVFNVRDDMPRAAGLYAALLDSPEGRGGFHSTVRLSHLFDRIVAYRNREIGHGAPGLRDPEFYGRMSRVLLAGAGEVLDRLDVLAGHRLLSVGEVRRDGTGSWIVDRYLLTGESPKRLEPLEIAEAESARVPRSEQVYLERPPGTGRPGLNPGLSALHPLVHFETSFGFYFLNARRGERGLEYLCYTTGQPIRRDKLPADHRALLARVLGQSVDEKAAEAWADHQMAQEPAAEELAEPEAARTIGGFTLIGRLGKGGMGVVYRAWQPSLRRQVALKCMLGVGNSEADQRFAREIRALGRVEHPNVVKVFASGTDKDQFFYAMELIEGAELSRVWAQLRSGSTTEIDESHWKTALRVACDQLRAEETRLSETEVTPRRSAEAAGAARAADETPLGARVHVTLVADLVRQVALATHVLHEADVIHRDIKPGNIMLTSDLKQPVLMDLGLAQLADETEGRLTRTRQFVGTLRYASPEQVYSAGRVDRRTDVYSLGATLWELLTLHPIFDYGDETTTPDLVLKIQTTDPESPRKHNKYVPRDLEAIVMKCLEKDRDRRYPTARDLALDLGRFLAGEPVEAQPQSLRYLLGKYIQRYRTRLAVAAAAIILLAGYGATAFVVTLNERDNKKIALYDRSIAFAEREITTNQDVGLANSLLNSEETCPEELRGWEWRYLMRLLDGQRAPLQGHDAGLWGGEFSPDGKSIATVSIDGTLKIWDTTTGKIRLDIDADRVSLLGDRVRQWLVRLGIPRLPITCVAFSPDSKHIATGSFAPLAEAILDKRRLRESRGLVRIWDAESGDLVDSYEEQLGVVLSLTYSPDGRRIVSSSIDPDNTFVVWDVENRKVVDVVSGHTSQIHRLRYSLDGRLLASAETDGVVKLWDARTLKQVLSFQAHPAPVVGVAFEPPGGARFATAGEDGTVRVWETASGRMALELRGHTGSALDVRYSPDGKRIASAGFDKTVRLWDAATGKEKLTLRGHTDTVWSVAFSRDGQQLLSASFDHTARIWDATPREERSGPGLFTIHSSRPGEPPASTEDGDHRVNSVAFSADARYLASASWDKEVRLRDGKTGALIKTFKGHSLVVWSVAFSPDGKWLASGSWDHTVKIWDRESGDVLRTFTEHTAPVHSVAFSPDGKRVVSGGFDGQVKVWGARTGTVTAHCDGFVFPILAVAFSPDGKHVASGGADRAVRIWDADRGEALLTLKGHTGAVHGLAFSPDGKRLASACWDHTVRIWNADPADQVADRAREVQIFNKHKERVHGVAFSADGRRVASVSEDKTVRIWDPNTGKEVVPERLLRGDVCGITFCPDGERVAVGCWTSSSWVKTLKAK